MWDSTACTTTENRAVRSCVCVRARARVCVRGRIEGIPAAATSCAWTMVVCVWSCACAGWVRRWSHTHTHIPYTLEDGTTCVCSAYGAGRSWHRPRLRTCRATRRNARGSGASFFVEHIRPGTSFVPRAQSAEAETGVPIPARVLHCRLAPFAVVLSEAADTSWAWQDIILNNNNPEIPTDTGKDPRTGQTCPGTSRGDTRGLSNCPCDGAPCAWEIVSSSIASYRYSSTASTFPTFTTASGFSYSI